MRIVRFFYLDSHNKLNLGDDTDVSNRKFLSRHVGDGSKHGFVDDSR